MSTEILLPKLGFTMTEGKITEWLASDGQAVTEGQPLYAVEADKATQEIESPASGVLKIVVAAGEEVEVGVLIGTID
jgi:pyruvate/2-oxoglutarate dehydrogenase complex dihydrolipoamide acyltransferase (E2) component